ncbi:MAG: polysaccharide pyruvyl transferase family protein [Sphingomonas sp.]|nr:polysaccharide pyruvyl transferase family protein [Sphingomonas sp.]MDX3883206.1 polysaccharide pyruvyl transferase family protein [Sphingomonas sp.]
MKIGIISTGGAGKIADWQKFSLRELYDRVGYNTGNLAFWGGIAKTISDEMEFLPWDFIPEDVHERFDLLLFPAANQLAAGVDLGFMADRFERANLPLIVAGLGTQSHSASDDVELTPGTQRWLSVVSERTAEIGVRGERSRDVLARYGIHNVTVIGCPSLFINEDPFLGRRIHHKYVEGGEKFLFCQGEMSAHSMPQERALFSLARKFRAPYICQAPDIVLALASGISDELTFDGMKRIRNYYCPNISFDEMLDFAEYNMRAFFDFEEWISFAQQHDFSVGARLHGNFLALQAGVPAMVVCQDGRMSELANTIQCPTIDPGLLRHDMGKLDFYRRFRFDHDAFDRNRADLAARYMKLFSAMGVSLKDYVARIAAPGLPPS